MFGTVLRTVCTFTAWRGLRTGISTVLSSQVAVSNTETSDCSVVTASACVAASVRSCGVFSSTDGSSPGVYTMVCHVTSVLLGTTCEDETRAQRRHEDTHPTKRVWIQSFVVRFQHCRIWEKHSSSVKSHFLIVHRSSVSYISLGGPIIFGEAPTIRTHNVAEDIFRDLETVSHAVPRIARPGVHLI